MEKFLLINSNAITIAGGDLLMPCTNVMAVEQATNATVTINFANQAAGYTTLTVTHSALPAYSAANPEQCRAMRNLFVDSIARALSTGWTTPTAQFFVPGFAELPALAANTNVVITGIVWS